MTCPVLSTCYRQLQHYYFPPGGDAPPTTAAFLSYDTSLEEWDGLGELIERDDAPTSTQRLRAFYALELVYFYLLPLGSHPVERVDIKTPLQVERPRDHAGIEELLQTCALVKRDITMRTGHTELLGKERNPALELMTASLRSVGGRLDKCVEMAQSLQSALDQGRKERRELGRVGYLFGDVLVANKTKITSSMPYLRTMLTISLNNPVKPWNQSTQFQV
jgi:hypothetical protein